MPFKKNLHSAVDRWSEKYDNAKIFNGINSDHDDLCSLFLFDDKQNSMVDGRNCFILLSILTTYIHTFFHQINVEVSGAKTRAIFDDVFDKMVTAAQPIPGFRRVKGGKILKVYYVQIDYFWVIFILQMTS